MAEPGSGGLSSGLGSVRFCGKDGTGPMINQSDVKYSDEELIEVLDARGMLSVDVARQYDERFADITESDVAEFMAKLGSEYCENCLRKSEGFRLCEDCDADL